MLITPLSPTSTVVMLMTPELSREVVWFAETTRYQLMLGWGLAVARQVKEAVSPSITVVFSGGIRITGATEGIETCK